MVSVLFSEPKIPQSPYDLVIIDEIERFSALQRAENSSIFFENFTGAYAAEFQCSSASRKFLNRTSDIFCGITFRVSVLFSDPKIPQSSSRASVMPGRSVSVLFSEPKIPQCVAFSEHVRFLKVSVLFSEPKIPQLSSSAVFLFPTRTEFQCSSASRKFLNFAERETPRL